MKGTMRYHTERRTRSRRRVWPDLASEVLHPVMRREDLCSWRDAGEGLRAAVEDVLDAPGTAAYQVQDSL